MRSRMRYFCMASLILFTVVGFTVAAFQEPAPPKPRTIPAAPGPSPSPSPDEQERIRIFTEEVILPIVAYDAYGHFDPTVGPADVLVLEDGIPQQVKSARRIPLNILILIDMGSLLPITQHLDVTRRVATRVLSKLRAGDSVALIQFTNRAEVLQDWTDDTAKVLKVLDPEHGKLLSGSRSRTTDGIKAATLKLAGKEVGSTHVVLITDGDDAPPNDYAVAVKQLLRYQPAVHVLSYTTMASQEIRKHRGGFFLDRQMKRFYQEQALATKASEQRLTEFAASLGGRIFLPASEDEALREGDELAGEIGATFVLTYTPKVAIASGDNSDSGRDPIPRRIEVFPRRTGLRVRALRTVASVFTSP